MTVLILGASGATGRLALAELLRREVPCKIILRPGSYLDPEAETKPLLTVIRASVLDLSHDELADILKGCHSILSCLGHTLSWRGVFGQPRRLVTEAAEKLCQVAQESKPETPIKYILMNTAGFQNRALGEEVPFSQACILSLLRTFLPPHRDNEDAASFLRDQIGQSHGALEWTAIRPDALIDEEQVSSYSLHSSPTRSAIFNSGQTSRINVAHFMAELITNDELWTQWRGKMPVIYNEESP